MQDYSDEDLRQIQERARERTRIAAHLPEDEDPILARFGHLVPTGEHGLGTSDTLLARAESGTLGTYAERLCDDCGAWLAKEIREITPGWAAWTWPPHRCAEMEARELAEQMARAEAMVREAAEREERLRHPTAQRVADVFLRCRLPHRAPLGLDRVRAGQVNPAALAACLAARETWLSGERPAKGLWLWGDTGRRKTTLLAALLFDVSHWTERPVVYWSLMDVIRQLRRQAAKLRSSWDPIQAEDAHLLCLDDLGRIRVTETAWEALSDLVGAAYEGCGSTVAQQTLYVASNQQPRALEQLLETPDHPEGGRVIARRLEAMCEVIEV